MASDKEDEEAWEQSSPTAHIVVAVLVVAFFVWVIYIGATSE